MAIVADRGGKAVEFSTPYYVEKCQERHIADLCNAMDRIGFDLASVSPALIAGTQAYYVLVFKVHNG